MSATREKARRLRLERLTKMLEQRLDHAASAVETLMSELKLGENQPDLWEQLHAAAARDEMEFEVAEAYQKVSVDRRLKDVSREAGAKVLMHAADFHQGVLGDRDGAFEYLWRVLDVVPSHEEAFTRLEGQFKADGDKLELANLYGKVAADPPIPTEKLAKLAMDSIFLLKATTPLPDETCRRLAVLARTTPRMLDVLDAHLKKTERGALAAELREHAILEFDLAEPILVEMRRALIDLYLDAAGTPEKAMPHVEALLERDFGDKRARAAAEKLLSTRAVASRAATIMHAIRRGDIELPPRD